MLELGCYKQNSKSSSYLTICFFFFSPPSLLISRRHLFWQAHHSWNTYSHTYGGFWHRWSICVFCKWNKKKKKIQTTNVFRWEKTGAHFQSSHNQHRFKINIENWMNEWLTHTSRLSSNAQIEYYLFMKLTNAKNFNEQIQNKAQNPR